MKHSIINGKPSVFVQPDELPKSVQQYFDVRNIDKIWEVAHTDEISIEAPELPPVARQTGWFIIETKEVVVTPSFWDGVYILNDIDTGDLVAYAAEEKDWYDIVSNTFTYLKGQFTLGNKPFLCIEELTQGLIISAQISTVEGGQYP